MRILFVFLLGFCCSVLPYENLPTESLIAASVDLGQARDVARIDKFDYNTDKAICFELGAAKGFRGANLYIIEKNVDRIKPFLELEYNLDVLVNGFCFMGTISRAEVLREIDKYIGELNSITVGLK